MNSPKPIRACQFCFKVLGTHQYKYCSNKCQAELRYKQYINLWLSGEVSGLQRLGVVSRHIKRYLREKYGNECCLCGWSKVNIYTGVVPLVADHEDGNWRNNIESNLRLVCPNCDALSATYAGLNRGNGRKERQLSKRVQEGRLLSTGTPP